MRLSTLFSSMANLKKFKCMSLILITLVTSGLYGCGGATSLSMGLGGHKAETKLVHLKAEKKVRPINFARNPSAAATAIGSIRIIRDSNIEAYLQSIVRRLMAHWHGPMPKRIGIFVKSGEGVGAQALPSGDIFINIGTFHHLKSEDALATLISHEVGHILLKHFQDEKDIRTATKVANIGAAIWVSKSIVQNSKMSRTGNSFRLNINDQRVNQDSLQAVLVRESIRFLTEDFALHSFSRYQEFKADQFSGENAKYAKYDHTALIDVLEGIQAAEKNKEKVKEETPDIKNLNGLVYGLIGSAVRSLSSSLRNTHPKAEDRIAQYGTHMSTHFGQGVRVRRNKTGYANSVRSGRFGRILIVHQKLSSAMRYARKGQRQKARRLAQQALSYTEANHPDVRLMIYNVLMASGAPRVAFQHLRAADLRKRGSISFYATLAKEYASRRQRSKLEALYDVAEKKLPQASMIYLSQIHSYVTLKDKQAVQAVIKKCKRTGNELLIENCYNVSRGICLDDNYRNTGSDLLKSISNIGSRTRHSRRSKPQKNC